MVADTQPASSNALAYETVAQPQRHVVTALMVAAAAWCIGVGLGHVWFVVARIVEGTLLAAPGTGLRSLMYFWPYVLFITSTALMIAILAHSRRRSDMTSLLLLLAAGAAVVAGAGYPVAAVLWWPPSLGANAYELYQRIIPLWGIVMYALVPALLLLAVLRPSPWQLRAACIGCPLSIGVGWALVLVLTPLTLFYPDQYSWAWYVAGPLLVRAGAWFATAGLLFMLCKRRSLGFRRAWAVIASLAALHVTVALATEYWMHGAQAFWPSSLFFGALQSIGFLAGAFVLPWITSRTELASPLGDHAPQALR